MRGWLFGLIMVFAAAFGVGGATSQQAETRVALIIANEAYISPSLGRLPGTQTDAALMQAALQHAGFAVTVQRNLNRTQMRAALSAFRGQLTSLGQRGVGFLYYSGHGVADGPRGQNWLVPVDAQISNVSDLPSTSVPLNEELDGIVLAGARATIIVIDACRNTPVALGRGSRGLAPVSARTDTLIAFSTDAGETAADDGLYARSLSEEISRPGSDAATAFARVQARVALATNRTQRPRYDNGLIEPVILVAGSSESATAAGTDSRAIELQFWRSCCDRAGAQETDYRSYLARYPHGEFASIAQQRAAPVAPSLANTRWVGTVTGDSDSSDVCSDRNRTTPGETLLFLDANRATFRDFFSAEGSYEQHGTQFTMSFPAYNAEVSGAVNGNTIFGRYRYTGDGYACHGTFEVRR